MNLFDIENDKHDIVFNINDTNIVIFRLNIMQLYKIS